MKIAVIGDVHGRDSWKKLNPEDYDRVVFLGDYFDSFDLPFKTQMENFKDILEFRITFPDKVRLLLGNHDWHYLGFTNMVYSGYQRKHSSKIKQILLPPVLDMTIKIAYLKNGYLFTHAGVTNTWLKNTEYTPHVRIDHFLNYLVVDNPLKLEFTSGKYFDPYGNEPCQTPLWVRPDSLMLDNLDTYIQVVGHTNHKKVTQINDVIFADCSSEFLILDNKEINIFKIDHDEDNSDI